MSTNEDELLRELDTHDALVARCARGELSWADFNAAYDGFYMRYPLDGHESDAEERLLFEKHVARIALHREIWEQVLTKVTGDEHLQQQATIDAGFIGSAVAVRRIRELAGKHLHSPMFDRAMRLRDSGQFDEAVELLEQLLRLLGPEDKRLSAHSHLQVGHIRKMQGRLVESERAFHEAVVIAPKMELGSLGLFHALHNLGRHVEAMEEAVRFLSLRESLGYRELLSGDAFGDDVPDDVQRLADRARSLLAKHREAQRGRSEPTKGDTVRVRSDAPEAVRPGSLASVRGRRTVETRDEAILHEVPVGTTLFRIAFSDGESVDLPRRLLDHSAI